GRAGPVSRCPLLLDCRLLSIEESLAIKGNGCCRLSVDRVPRRFAYPLHGQPTRFAPRLAVASGNLLQPAMTLHVSATRSSPEINGTKNVKFRPLGAFSGSRVQIPLIKGIVTPCNRHWSRRRKFQKCNRHLQRQLAPLVPSYQALLTTAAEPVRQSQRILHKCSSASTRLAAH